MNKVCWYRRGMNKHLSQNGYVHFNAKVPMDEDFCEGTPYTFNEIKKTFGKCDLVFDTNTANKITEELVCEMNADTKAPRCPQCDGTGEGYAPGTSCSMCGGEGY